MSFLISTNLFETQQKWKYWICLDCKTLNTIFTLPFCQKGHPNVLSLRNLEEIQRVQEIFSLLEGTKQEIITESQHSQSMYFLPKGLFEQNHHHRGKRRAKARSYQKTLGSTFWRKTYEKRDPIFGVL